MSRGWIDKTALSQLEAEGTTAHRVWTGGSSWIERFGSDYVLSDPTGDEAMAGELREWVAGSGLDLRRIFSRTLVKQPGESDLPRLIAGDETAEKSAVVKERGLRFSVDFSAGYSAGLFCDQRTNRAHLETIEPERVLNCFAYTCAFSVAAARAGAETLSVDLASKALDTGRRNFELNGMAGKRHRFFADDVFSVLPRLARRAEVFDVIILDPPTFSRGKGGRVFRADDDFQRLLELALPLLTKGGSLLASTNSRRRGAVDLGRLGTGLRPDPLSPFNDGNLPGTSSTVWLRPAAGG